MILEVALLSFALPAGAAASPESLAAARPQDPLARPILLGAGRNALARRDLPQAIARFRRLVLRFPAEEEGRRELAGALARAGRPREAIAEVLVLLERQPRNRILHQMLADLYLAVHDQPRAARELIWIAVRYPGDLVTATRLADLLRWMGLAREARRQYDRVLAAKGDHGLALLGKAQLEIDAQRPHEALRLLGALGPRSRSERHAQLTLAHAKLRAGDHAGSRRTCDALLAIDPTDSKARLALAGVLEATELYTEARGEFAKVLRDRPADPEASAGTARCLIRQRRLSQARAVLEGALSRPVDDPGPLLDALVVLVRATPAAPHGGATAPAGLPGPGLAAVEAAVWPGPRRLPPDLARAMARRMMERQELMGVLGPPPVSPTTGQVPLDAIRVRMDASDLLRADGQYERAADLCRQVLAHDPESLPAITRLAEAQRDSAVRGSRRVAPTSFARALALQPDNLRARLGLARALSYTRRFRPSYAEYARVIALFPDHSVARREWARVHSWESGGRRSASHYRALLSAPASDRLVRVVARLKASGPAGAHAAARESLARIAAAPPPSEALGAAVSAVAARLPVSDPLRRALDHALIDLEAHRAIEAAVTLESAAKRCKDSRPAMAVGLFRRLVELEPANDEARFDLAQTLSVLGRTRDADRAYVDLARENPRHGPTAVARPRNRRLLGTSVAATLRSFIQIGRGVLARMRRRRPLVEARLPIGDEDEAVALVGGSSHAGAPGERPHDAGLAQVKVQKRLSRDLLAWAAAGRGDSEPRQGGPLLYDVGLSQHLGERLRLGARALVENVAENGQTLDEGIHRRGLRVNAALRPSEAVDLAATYGRWSYSDDNVLREFDLSAAWRLTRVPRQISLIGGVGTLDFSEGTGFGPVADDLASARHPYFAPSGFRTIRAGIEWRHWLSEDVFRGAPECWYELRYARSHDSQGVSMDHYGLGARVEVALGLDLAVDVGLVRSEIYDAQTAGVVATWRFEPGR